MIEYFKTKKRLNVALDNIDRIEGLQDYLDNTFHYLYLSCDNCNNHYAIHECPDWLVSINDNWNIPIYSFGNPGVHLNNNYYKTLGELITCEYKLTESNLSMEHYVQYIAGYYEPLFYGSKVTENGEDFIYVDSVALPEEIEYQTEDANYAYEYRGASFLRILKKVVK